MRRDRIKLTRTRFYALSQRLGTFNFPSEVASESLIGCWTEQVAMDTFFDTERPNDTHGRKVVSFLEKATNSRFANTRNFASICEAVLIVWPYHLHEIRADDDCFYWIQLFAAWLFVD